MNSWIKTHIMFGVPEKQFEIPHRTKMGMELSRRMHEIKDKENPTLFENMLLEFIEEFRPNLKGCTVYFMDFNASRMSWRFHVFHPDFPRDPKSPAFIPKVERFDLCPLCNGQLSLEEHFVREVHHNKPTANGFWSETWEVCETCSKR